MGFKPLTRLAQEEPSLSVMFEQQIADSKVAEAIVRELLQLYK